MSSELLTTLDIRAAVEEEAAWEPDLVPTPVITKMARDDPDFVTDYVAQLAQAGLDTVTASVISASKWRFGRRPVALLPIVERVLYRAVVNLLGVDLPPLVRSNEKHDAFLNAPLEEPEHFVVVTDIANFHSSIPTNSLARELVHQTGPLGTS